jgi:hypothetical protein
MAYKYQALGDRSAPLNSAKCEAQSETVIATLKKPDQVSLFRVAAQAVVDVAGGKMPSSDRLKPQQFTQELIAYLTK